ncbi:hypothetical protein [Limnoglobus roseus]|uniref:Uncharacterized protein n=1 Tax=Limnoglobus roseus TaxID=2598579 RepID=A0A5C1API1_9BACT|nr:hypothetical protein [Limnoglobus roseus]QEL19926.1 hypothetical protein PX52LOC_07008 [Limnoglobus roseus]
MRCSLVLVVVFFVADVPAADEAPKASATRDGKKCKFPEKGVAAGVEATTALLETCRDKAAGTADDMKKARDGDHVRLVFAKPVAVMVGDMKLEVSELVLTLPLNTGVFWLRAGDKVIRCTKYRFEKEEDFLAWCYTATRAD